MEGCKLLGGVDADMVEGVEFGLGMKIVAKGLSGFEGDVSEPSTGFLAPQKKKKPPLALGAGGGNIQPCVTASPGCEWATAGKQRRKGCSR